MEIRIGGVPEHYNLPWHWALENQLFEKNGFTVSWKSYPNGTGAMLKDLRESNLDIAILLTEGAVADILQGNPSKIVQTWVSSPLRWGIHTGANSGIERVEDLKGKRYAISRFKSGSHLMAYVNARTYNWQIQTEDFVLVENLEGARKAFAEKRAEIFFWEKFTTKHLVDSGEFRYLGDCYTPWPSFVIAVRNEVLAQNEKEVARLLVWINKLAREMTLRSDILEILVKKYSMLTEDAREWFSKLQWYHGGGFAFDPSALLTQLSEYGLIPANSDPSEVFYFRDEVVEEEE